MTRSARSAYTRDLKVVGQRLDWKGLREGLRNLGYREGESFVIEQRKVEGRFERLQAAV